MAAVCKALLYCLCADYYHRAQRRVPLYNKICSKTATAYRLITRHCCIGDEKWRAINCSVGKINAHQVERRVRRRAVWGGKADWGLAAK